MDFAELMERYPDIPDYAVGAGVARDKEIEHNLPEGTLDPIIHWRHRSDAQRIERNER